MIKKEIKKYKSYEELFEKNGALYSGIIRAGLKDDKELMGHLEKRDGIYKWPKEKVLEDALKYDSIKSWRYYSSAAYSTAWNKGWLNEVSAHTRKDGTFYKRSTREKVYRMANENQINLRIVECCCPVEVIKRRMNRRKRNKYPLSQADYETYKKISAQFDAIRREHIIVDTSNFLRSSITEVIYKLRKDMD